MKKQFYKCLIFMLIAALMCAPFAVTCSAEESSSVSVSEPELAHDDEYQANSHMDGIFRYTLSKDGKEACLEGIEGTFDGVVEIPETVGGVPLVALNLFSYQYGTYYKGLKIPASVRRIYISPFASHGKLTSLTVDEENKYFKADNNILYTADMSTLIGCPQNISGIFDVPSEVKKIADSAFYGCKKLKTVNLPNGLTEIGSEAFQDCEALTGLSIGANVEKIGEEAFLLCRGLENIYVSPDNKYYCDVDGMLLTKDKKNFITFPLTRTSCVVPEGVVKLGYAFSGASKLKELTLPSTIEDYCEENFAGCDALVNITYPSTTKKINIEPFLRFKYLKNIFINKNNKTFCDANGVLYSKDMKRLLFYPSAKTDGIHVRYTIPDGVTTVTSRSFESLSNLAKIELTVPESVTKISYRAFDNFESLTIFGKAGSYAETYARRYVPAVFVALDAPAQESSEPAANTAETSSETEAPAETSKSEKFMLYAVIILVVILIICVIVIAVLLTYKKKKNASADIESDDIAETEELPETPEFPFNIIDESETETEPEQADAKQSEELESSFGSIDDEE